MTLGTGEIMLAASLMLAVTGVALLAARRLHVGSIVGLIGAGMILGPHSPHPVFTDHVPELQAVGEIGVILLLFLIALDIKPARLWEMRSSVARFGAGQYFATTLGLAATLGWLTPLGWKSALVMALGLAMTSSAIALPALAEHGDFGSVRGRVVLAVDVFQGFMVAPVLALVPVLAARDGALASWSVGAALQAAAALAAVVGVALVVLPRALFIASGSLGSGAFSILVLAAVLFASWAMDFVGASAAMGAFLLGILLSTFVFAAQIRAAVAPAKQALLALFFLSVGMAIDPAQVFEERLLLLQIVPGIFAVKLAIGYAVARAGRLAARDALMASLLFAPLDEVAYVIFAGARDGGLLDARAYAISLSVLSLSFVLSPLAIRLGYLLEGRTHGRGPAAAAGGTAPSPASPVIMFGYGPVGRAVCTLLALARVPFTCFDDDLGHVAEGKRRGHDVRFGHLGRPSDLWAFGIPGARLVIVAAEPFAYATQVLALLHEFQPGVRTLAAVTYLFQRDALRASGIQDAHALVPEGALGFGRVVLRSVGVDSPSIEPLVEALRRDDYAALRGAPS